MNILKKVYKFLTSFLLAVIILILLTIVTLVGTLDQEFLGLWPATKKYFHSGLIQSDYIEQKINSIELNRSIENGTTAKTVKLPPLILPGGLLLMSALFINMVLGAVVHVRKRARGIPNLISHFSILFLFVGAFLTFAFKRDGFVALYPGQASNTAHSYKEWQVEILEFSADGKPTKAHVIPWEQLLSIGKRGSGKEFHSKNLPFRVKIDTFLRNAQPTQASDSRAIDRVVNGLKLKALKSNTKVERNFPGCFASIYSDDGSDKLNEIILSGISSSIIPGEGADVAGFKIADKQYGLQLVKKNWQLPYYIHLDKFIFEKHPGTDKPKNFESRITRIDSLEGAIKEKVAIRMNEPMRKGGFVVFQESFGDPRDEGTYFSQFAVADNPSDRWPEIALWIMMVGLVFHFVWKLVEYINKSAKRG